MRSRKILKWRSSSVLLAETVRHLGKMISSSFFTETATFSRFENQFQYSLRVIDVSRHSTKRSSPITPGPNQRSPFFSSGQLRTEVLQFGVLTYRERNYETSRKTGTYMEVLISLQDPPRGKVRVCAFQLGDPVTPRAERRYGIPTRIVADNFWISILRPVMIHKQSFFLQWIDIARKGRSHRVRIGSGGQLE